MANQPNIPITSSFNDKGIRDAEREFKSLSDTIKKAGSGISSAGQTLTRNLTVPIVGMGAAIIATSGNFEAGMNRVRAVSGATGDDFEALREQAKMLGRTTQYSATQAADAMGFLAMAGFDVEEILGAMPNTLNLAAAAQIDLGTAADITSNIMSGYGVSVEDLAAANDALVKTFTSTNTTLEMLGESFVYAGPVASAAGIQFEEAAAAIGLMGNAGIQGSMAGTSLRGAITRLLTPSNEAKDIMKELGLNVLDAEGNLVSMEEIVRQLEDSGANTAQMMEIFGQRAGPAMMALVSQGSEALADLTTDLENAGGTAEQVASIQMEGFNGAMTELKSAAEGLMIAIGDAGLLASMTNLAEQTTVLTQNLASVDPELLKMATITAGVVAAVGPALLVIGKLVTLVGALANPVGIAVVVIAALTAAFIYAYRNFEDFRNIVDNVVDSVVNFAQNALVWLRNAFDQIQPTLQRVGEIASEVFATVVAAIQAAIPPVTEFITNVIETLINVWGDVSQAVQDFYARFIEIFGPIAGWFNDNVVSTIVSAVEYLIEVFKTIYRLVAPGINLLMELFQFLAYTIANVVIFIVGRISDFVGMITRIFIGFFDYLKPVFSLFWDGLVLIVKTVFEIFENTIEIGLAVIRGLFEIGTALLKGDFGAVWDAMKQIVIDAFDAIKDLVVTSFDNIVGFLKTVPSKIASATVGMFNGIKNAFKEAINFVIRGWNRLEFRVPGFSIGPIGYDGFTLGVPDIPLLADGGIVNRATLAVIGEAGPEAVVPLDQMRGGLGGATYNITVQAGVGDPGTIGQSVVEAITAYERRNGAGWRAA